MNMKYFLGVLLVFVISCRQHKETAEVQAPVKSAEPAKAPEQVVAPVSIDATSPAVAEEALPDNDKVAKASETPGDSVMRFIVSFYSAGGGIDRGEPEKLFTYVESFGKKIHVQINYAVTQWGREGERDYCFTLSELNSDQSIKFIAGAKNALSAAQHVNYMENQPCRKGR